MPNREMSNLDIAVAIISKTQQASPNCRGNTDDLRAQLSNMSTDVIMALRLRSSGISTSGSGYCSTRVAFIRLTA